MLTSTWVLLQWATASSSAASRIFRMRGGSYGFFPSFKAPPAVSVLELQRRITEQVPTLDDCAALGVLLESLSLRPADRFAEGDPLEEVIVHPVVNPRLELRVRDPRRTKGRKRATVRNEEHRLVDHRPELVLVPLDLAGPREEHRPLAVLWQALDVGLREEALVRPHLLAAVAEVVGREWTASKAREERRPSLVDAVVEVRVGHLGPRRELRGGLGCLSREGDVSRPLVVEGDELGLPRRLEDAALAGDLLDEGVRLLGRLDRQAPDRKLGDPVAVDVGVGVLGRHATKLAVIEVDRGDERHGARAREVPGVEGVVPDEEDEACASLRRDVRDQRLHGLRLEDPGAEVVVRAVDVDDERPESVPLLELGDTARLGLEGRVGEDQVVRRM